VAHGDGQRTADFLQAMQDGDVQVAAGRHSSCVPGGRGPCHRPARAVPEGAEDVGTNNRIRRELGRRWPPWLLSPTRPRGWTARAMRKGATPTACAARQGLAQGERGRQGRAGAGPLGQQLGSEAPPSAGGRGPAGRSGHPVTRLLLNERLAQETDAKAAALQARWPRWPPGWPGANAWACCSPA
jgi:hypothetical protein